MSTCCLYVDAMLAYRAESWLSTWTAHMVTVVAAVTGCQHGQHTAWWWWLSYAVNMDSTYGDGRGGCHWLSTCTLYSVSHHLMNEANYIVTRSLTFRPTSCRFLQALAACFPEMRSNHQCERSVLVKPHSATVAESLSASGGSHLLLVVRAIFCLYGKATVC